MERVDLLRGYGIRAILIIDGESLPAKAEITDKRRRLVFYSHLTIKQDDFLGPSLKRFV